MNYNKQVHKTIEIETKIVYIQFMRTIKNYTGLLLILLVALGIRWWNINWGLPEVYEEAYPFHIAWKFWNWGNSGFNFNPHFYNYPALTFLLQFIVQGFHYLVGSISGSFSGIESFKQAYDADPTSSLILARSVSVVFDLGTIAVTYLLSKKIFSKNVALFSALIVAINPLHISQAHLVTVDPALTFFSVLSVYFIYHVYKNAGTTWYILSGLAIGLAAASKYNGALLILVLLVAHAMRKKSLSLAISSLVNKKLMMSVLITVTTFFMLNPFILFNYDEFYQGFSFEQYHVSSGHLGIDQTQSAFGYYFFNTFPSLLGIPFLIIIVLSLGYIFYQRDKEKLLPVLFPLLYLGVLLTWEMRVERYVLPIFPFFIMIGSVGISAVGEKIVGFIGKKRELNASKALVFDSGTKWSLMILCCIPLLIHTAQYQKSLSLPDTRTIVKQWINSNLKVGTAIATVPLGIELDKNKFILIPIPYHPVLSEMTEPFYSYNLYKDIDVVIASSFDYSRYLVDPVKYNRFIKFYDSLKVRSTLLYQIKPDENQSGPEISLYKPDTSFADERVDATTINELKNSEKTEATTNFAGKLAITMMLKGRLAKSEQLYRLVVDLDPQNKVGRNELIKLLVRSQQFSEAILQIDKYIEFQSPDAEMFATKGELLLNLQRFSEAEAPLLKALELNNKLETPYINLSIIYSYQNNKNKVIDIVRKYLTIIPQGSEKYKLVQQQLEKLAEMPD